MKILVLTNNIGGLYSFRKEVIKAFVDKDAKMYISYPDDDERQDYFKQLGCEMISIKLERRGINPVKDLKLLTDYIRLIKKINPDLVLSYTIKPNIYGGIACRLCNVPQFANITGLGDAVENGGILQRMIILMYKIGLKKVQTVFFQNKNNLNFFLKKRILSSKYILLPGSGVNLDYHIYQKYPQEDKLKFLFIARLIKTKGVDEYLEMAQKIKREHPNTEFQILGDIDDNYRSIIDKLVNENIIKYLGKTTDVRPYLKEVHCTILPSYHEGMSNVNLESQANGRPVITTNVPGCVETILDNVSGYLVEARNALDLIQKVETFIQLSHEEKKNMGVLGRKYVEENFSRKIVVNAYLEESLIRSKNAL